MEAILQPFVGLGPALQERNELLRLFNHNGQLSAKLPGPTGHDEGNETFFSFDWTSTVHKWLKNSPKKSEPFAKAIKPTAVEGVIDATAGSGKDALYIASLGVQVQSFERDFAVFLLLQDAHRRLLEHGDSKVQELASRISFHFGDVRELKSDNLQGWGFYYDPMYMQTGGKGDRKRHHHALPRKDMQFLRWRESLELRPPRGGHQSTIETFEREVSDIFHWAHTRGAKRLIFKRPLKAPGFIPEGLRREVAFEGKSTRYELFVPKTPAS